MKKIWASLLLVALAFLIYLPALRGGFVWDDRALVLTDPLIRSWRLLGEGFEHFLFTDASPSDFYRPLQRLSYLLDYGVFVFAPAGYHFTSIFWHAAAAAAFFFFAEELLSFCGIAPQRGGTIAFLAALAWVIHPVQSAAVVYVSGRADPLCATFGFAGLFLGLRMLRADDAKKWAFGFGTGSAFLASVLSKEMGLLFLALWLLIAIARGPRENLWRALGMIAAVAVIYFSLRLPAEHIAPPPPRHALPLFVRPIVIARAVAEYAGLLVLPLHLHMDRDVETHPFGFVQASLAGASWRELQTLLGVILLATAAYALWRGRRQPAIFFPLLLAFVSYLPVSGLVTLNATVAEHWLYLPSAFLFLAGAALFDSLGGFARGRRTLAICLTIWLLFLCGRTFVRTFDWKDQRTFLTQTISAGGDSARMLINLGGLELSEGHLDAARAALEQALVREPEEPLALLNLAAVAIKAEDFARARQLLESITDPAEIKARAQESLAVLEYRESGKVDLLRLRLAARLGPPNWAIEKRYLSALRDSGDVEGAIVELRTCLTIAPYRAESWLMMSELLKQIRQPNESARALAEAEADDVHLNEHSETRVAQR